MTESFGSNGLTAQNLFVGIKMQRAQGWASAFRRSRSIFLAATALSLSSCASYTDQTKGVRNAIFAGEYDKAIEKLDQSALAEQKRNRVLYLMERGTILFLDNQYRSAAADWRKASEASEQLYTVSLSNTAASLAVNDSYSDYEGELHERVLLPIFAALAYLADGDVQSARVEVRRADELMTALENAGSDKPEYARDSFANLLSGIIYESLGEWDSAIIEYRRGLQNLNSSRASSDTAISKVHFAEPLCRLAKLRNRQDVLKDARALLKSQSACPDPEQWRKMAEVIVFYENGRSPIKVPRDIVLPVAGQVVRVSYPSYERMPYSSRYMSVSVDDAKVGRTELVQDIGQLARKSLDARRAKDIVKMTARIIAKDQAARATGRALGPLAGLAASIVGAVTETADTRGWTSLPDEIQVVRTWVNVPSGSKTVTLRIDPDNGKPAIREIKLSEGKKSFVRYRTFY